VLILYSDHDAQPTLREQTQHDGEVPAFDDVEEATANCDFLNIVLTKEDHSRRQCIAIMGQSESFHIQRFMRLPATGRLNASVPLRQVGRMMDENGDNFGYVPQPQDLVSHGERIRDFLGNMNSVLDALRPLAARAAGNKDVIVIMFANFGQSELIINFCCSARARNLDISSLLIFATDIESKELLEGFGLNVFYEERIFGHLPKDASKIFGDANFHAMMAGKVFCIKLAIMLGYDVLFQDADVVWYKDPLPYFRNESLAQFDVLIADDGSPRTG
jgi:Nucleotide-diphospho-sugar transferase